MENIPNSFYRVSIKGLILDETRTKFATVLEELGWELPGGGMDWGETPEECIRREVKEEMGLEVTSVASLPSYILIGKNMRGYLCVYLVFEISVENLDYTPSDECTELRFVSPEEARALDNPFRTVTELADLFDPKKHVR